MMTALPTNILRKDSMFSAFLRRVLAPGFVVILAPALLPAQDCLGLHRPRAVPTVEVTAGFARDGITGPSNLSAGVQARGLFALVETGADQAARSSAFSVNGLGATVGVRRSVKAAAVCVGAGVASEDIGRTSTSAQSLLAAAGVPLSFVPKVPVTVFGVARAERRSSRLAQGPSETENGLALRIGASAYPRPWVGVRVFEDFAQSTHRTGFSVSAVLPLTR
jgi:hypothetical protein